jgi:diaminopimelate decarboxylase
MTGTNWDNIQGTQFEELATTYDTPYYLFDADQVIERIESVRKALGGLAAVYYAVKANPNLELLRSVREAVDGLDISSGGELGQALLAGYRPTQLSFAGPGKTSAELSEAVAAGIGCISVESTREIDELGEISRKSNAPVHIVFRVNPEKLVRAFGLKMGGRSTQFGIEESNLLDAAASLSQYPRIVVRGIHVYAGSQCFDAEAVAEGVSNTLRIVDDLECRTGLHCELVNFGGGFGVDHGISAAELNLDELGALVRPILSDFQGGSSGNRRFVFELGRYLTATAGIYVTRVVSEKQSRGKDYFVCDGGLNHHLAAAGTFGTALRANYPILNLSNPGAVPAAVNVAGPSCNPTDLLGVNVEIPRPAIGNLLGVAKSGSYGLTASPVWFLGRRTPAELVHRDGQFVLGRRSMDITEFN